MILNEKLSIIVRRIGAAAIDWLMFVVVHFLFSLVVGMWSLLGAESFSKQFDRIPSEKVELAKTTHTVLMQSTLFTNVVSIVLFSAFIIYRHVKYSATPGKLFCGIKVQKLDGSPVTYGDATIRFSPYMVFLILYVFLLLTNDMNTLRSLDGLSPFVSIDLLIPLNVLIGIWLLGSIVWASFDPFNRFPHDLPVNTIVAKA